MFKLNFYVRFCVIVIFVIRATTYGAFTICQAPRSIYIHFHVEFSQQSCEISAILILQIWKLGHSVTNWSKVTQLLSDRIRCLRLQSPHFFLNVISCCLPSVTHSLMRESIDWPVHDVSDPLLNAMEDTEINLAF